MFESDLDDGDLGVVGSDVEFCCLVDGFGKYFESL